MLSLIEERRQMKQKRHGKLNADQQKKVRKIDILTKWNCNDDRCNDEVQLFSFLL